MPTILHIETSTDLCSVALSDDANVLYSFVSSSKNEHASTLSLYIEDALKQSGRTFKDLSAIAVGIGPGSYTGLRIGVSATKGLAYALNIPVIGVSPLKAMVSHVINEDKSKDEGIPPRYARGRAVAPSPRPQAGCGLSAPSLMRFIPMLDAGRMEVYTAAFDYDLNEIMPVQALILEPTTFESLAEKHTLVFFGSGSNKFREIMPSADKHIFINDITPLASYMIPLATQAYATRDFLDTAYFEPLYIKEFIAKAPSVKGLK